MATNQAKMEGNPSQKTAKALVLFHISLRLIAFATAIAATLVMVSSKQTVNVFGIIMKAEYSSSPAFKFFVVGNAVASGYALLSIPLALIFSFIASGKNGHFFLVLFDLTVMGLVIAAASAATAIGYVGKKGNSETGWAPICGQVGKFCDKVGSSIFCSFAAAATYFMIILVSTSKARQVPVSSSQA